MAADAKQWLLWVTELQALAQCGLTYTVNEFDKGRFLRVIEMAAEMAAELTENNPIPIKNLFALELNAYATPRIDVRSFVLKDDKLLLVKERSDGLWTLPGGFADVNESPGEAVERETLEESGFVVKAVKLLAFWDKLKHDHPLSWPHIYKCIFHCDLLSGEPKDNIEISEIDFFDIEKLPPLSIHRITERQLKILYAAVKNPRETLFD